ncbi:MAG TPA: PEP-CTERM sorting domain-containing protein [Methylomirabilota bacterium]|jgi:hypothetical protein
MIRLALVAAAALLMLVGFPVMDAQAATIWTDWSSAIGGFPGSASGTLNGVGVSYSGEVSGAITNGSDSIWTPTSSFIGGTVTTSPNVVKDDIQLNGTTGTNTITFASPVQNPIFAIWSLGAPSEPASFTFDATPALQAGGPNGQFGGVSIGVAGNVVSGHEGNGVVQFSGTFNSISWTDTPEHFYAFTVGMNGPLAPPTPVPEPASLILFGSGLAGLIWRLRRQR